MATSAKNNNKKKVVQQDTVVLDLREWVEENNIVSRYPKVLVNVNDYPYVCFMKKDGTTENVYFSINAAQTVNAGDVVDKQFISRFKLLETVNAEGETRIKFGTSTSVDIDDLF